MILIVDNYDSFTYNLYQAMSEHTTDIQVVRNDKITLDEITALSPSGIVFSPGPGRPEDAGICVEAIRHFADSIPMLGVCLGHQAMAVAFGGQVVKAPEIVHGKSDTVFHSRSTLYRDVPLPFEAARYHSLVVDRDSLPDVLKVEAETSDELVMGMRHVSHPVFGLQFHPESILSGHGPQIIQNFLGVCAKC